MRASVHFSICSSTAELALFRYGIAAASASAAASLARCIPVTASSPRRSTESLTLRAPHKKRLGPILSPSSTRAHAQTCNPAAASTPCSERDLSTSSALEPSKIPTNRGQDPLKFSFSMVSGRPSSKSLLPATGNCLLRPLKLYLAIKRSRDDVWSLIPLSRFFLCFS